MEKIPPGLDASLFIAVVDEFVSATDTSRVFQGTVDLPGSGARVEYCLPGRRIVKHFAKLARSEPIIDRKRQSEQEDDASVPRSTTTRHIL